jgi:hypothetical protein
MYWTMKEIGLRLSLTSHQVGKALKSLGLRTQDGKPSQTAFERHLCAQLWDSSGEHYLWAWDVDRVTPLIAATLANNQQSKPAT